MKAALIQKFREQVEYQLFENIVPFWINHTQDTEFGGFYGRIANDLTIEKEASKSLILNTRILWTFSALYQFQQNPEFLRMADRSYDYINKYFFDHELGPGMHGNIKTVKNIIFVLFKK